MSQMEDRYSEILCILHENANEDIAKKHMMFFKSGVNSYCADDKFLGIKMPTLRLLAKSLRFKLSKEDFAKLATNEFNEIRIIAWLLFEKMEENEEILLDLIKKTAKECRNGNVVDTAASIVTKKLNFNEKLIKKLGIFLFNEKNLWSIRFSIVLSLNLIKKNKLDYALYICKKNLENKEDLIKKATGWMLREVGKKDRNKLISFIEQNHGIISKTTLSYSLEHFTLEDKKELKERLGI